MSEARIRHLRGPQAKLDELLGSFQALQARVGQAGAVEDQYRQGRQGGDVGQPGAGELGIVGKIELLQFGHCLEVRQAGALDHALGEHEAFQLHQAGERRQVRVGDTRVRQVQVVELGHAFQVSQAGCPDLDTLEVQGLQGGQACQVGQARVGDLQRAARLSVRISLRSLRCARPASVRFGTPDR